MLDLVALTALDVACDRRLLTEAAEAHQITSIKLYGRLNTIKRRFLHYALPPERKLTGRGNLYEWIIYLAAKQWNSAGESDLILL